MSAARDRSAMAWHHVRLSTMIISAVVALLAGSAGADPAVVRSPTTRTTPRAALCTLPPRARALPPAARRGLIGHLQLYPEMSLSTAAHRGAARLLLDKIRAAAERQGWDDPRRVAAAGFDIRTKPRRPGSLTVGYLHAELPHERRAGAPSLDPRRPKAVIYANVPGRPLRLVGAMYSMRRGERGPDLAGPITRWHSHLVCARGDLRGRKPHADGSCPAGTKRRQGSEMLHVWFTKDLRSAFAVRAPERELCRDGMLPRGSCRAAQPT